MRRNQRYISAAAAAIVLLALGCSRTGSRKIEIALVTKALDSEFWQRMKSGAEEAAREDPDVKLAILAPTQEINIDQQVSILEDLILKRVAAIAVAPAGVSEIMPVLDKAKAAGIPVVIVDTEAPWPSRASFIGIDNRLGGRMAGEHIIQAIGGKGKVAVIRGVLGVSTQEDRLTGFRDSIANQPGIELVSVQPANSERAMGLGVMENILTSHPDLKAVFATNDQMALGAIEAIAARRLTGKIVVVGFDAGQEALRAIDAGKLSAVMAQYPDRIGRRAIEEAIKAAKGQPVEKRVEIGTALVTRENVGQFPH